MEAEPGEVGAKARFGTGHAQVAHHRQPKAAADGCAATIHAAAAIGMTGHDGTSVLDVNTTGARTVVDAALAAGHDPVVHVSSVAVFVPPTGPVIDPGSPLASPRTDYGRSKVVTETELRARQDAGDPVTIVYPGGVIGRDQPHLDATLEGLVAARTQGWPKTTGGVNLVDVQQLILETLREFLEGFPLLDPHSE